MRIKVLFAVVRHRRGWVAETALRVEGRARERREEAIMLLCDLEALKNLRRTEQLTKFKERRGMDGVEYIRDSVYPKTHFTSGRLHFTSPLALPRVPGALSSIRASETAGIWRALSCGIIRRTSLGSYGQAEPASVSRLLQYDIAPTHEHRHQFGRTRIS